MVIADRILDETPPGSVTAVVGRPGAGVSTLIERVCTAATKTSEVVLASWEKAPPSPAAIAGAIVRPLILGWSVEELGRCREVLDADPGTVIGIDYLQLINGSAEQAARSFGSLATSRSWRLVLGMMAPRDLKALDTALSPALAVRRVGQVLAAALHHVDRAIVITGGDKGTRTASLGVPTTTGGWRLSWTAHTDETRST